MIYALIIEEAHVGEQDYYWTTWTQGTSEKSIERKVVARYNDCYGLREEIEPGEEAWPYTDYGFADFSLQFFKSKKAMTEALLKNRKF